MKVKADSVLLVATQLSAMLLSENWLSAAARSLTVVATDQDYWLLVCCLEVEVACFAALEPTPHWLRP
jgi:hypothetical protein